MRLAFLLIALIPLIGFTAAWQWRRRLERIQSDSGFLRREKAFKSAQQGIRNLEQASDRKFPEKAAQILRTFIGDKAGIDGGSLTPADVHPRLESLGISPETRNGILKFLESCDAALYGGQTVTPEMRQRFIQDVTSLIGRAGKEIRT